MGTASFGTGLHSRKDLKAGGLIKRMSLKTVKFSGWTLVTSDSYAIARAHPFKPDIPYISGTTQKRIAGWSEFKYVQGFTINYGQKSLMKLKDVISTGL